MEFIYMELKQWNGIFTLYISIYIYIKYIYNIYYIYTYI